MRPPPVGAPLWRRRGAVPGTYEDWTVPELKQRAKELGLSGYSGKNKRSLIDDAARPRKQTHVPMMRVTNEEKK